MHIETKFFNGRVTEVKQEERNGVPVGIISGHIATWDIDRWEDKFVKGCFAESIKEHKKKKRQVRFKGFHGKIIGGFPIDTVKEDDKGLFGRGEVNLSTKAGAEIFSLARQGVLTDFSIGFTAVDREFEGDIRIIKKAIIWEGSIVDEPMNERATVTEVKSAIEQATCPGELKEALNNIENITPELVQTILNIIEQKTNYLSEEEIKPFINEHACRLMEPGQFDSFRRKNNAGKVDGKRIDHIIGIKKDGSSDLQSIRYPESIWKSSDAKAHCKGRDGKFESAKKEMIFAIENMKDLSDREFEDKLKTGVKFSGKNAKAIISVLKAAGLRDGDDDGRRDGEELKQLMAELKALKTTMKGDQ
jgi:HK97 family phage prohead protease